MKDESFELLTKLYAEFSGFKKNTEEQFTELRQQVLAIDNTVIRIENEHGQKLDALFDGYKQLAESQEEMKIDIKDIKARQESQEVEIRVIKGGKGKKAK